MTKQQFIEKFGQEFGVPASKLTDDAVLASFPSWDSLARMATIAMFDSELGLELPQGSLQGCVTVGDVITLVQDSLSG